MERIDTATAVKLALTHVSDATLLDFINFALAEQRRRIRLSVTKKTQVVRIELPDCMPGVIKTGISR